MAAVAKADRRSRSSGGKFSGWMSGSNLLLRRDEEKDEGSVECRESLEERDGLVLAGVAESGWTECRDEVDFFVGDLDWGFVGEEGSDREECCESSPRSSKLLGGTEDEEGGFFEDGRLLVPVPKKFFIWAKPYFPPVCTIMAFFPLVNAIGTFCPASLCFH